MEAPIRFIHLVAAAYWLGGLVLLAAVVVVGLRTLPRDTFRSLLVPVARAFAWGSAVAWLLLGVTGYLMASRRLASLDALASTPYGRRLSLKLVLVAVTLVAAALHVVLGRASSPRLVMLSRTMAVAAFLLTLGVFYTAARLAAG